ncbi:Golgi apparatus membrane protein tvp38 [Cytospora mali]|uniref:Golgi apparatus membrane protein TVP38 n=1 Tax=Cytospora mali TaxID=578113 RepID=A0A194UR10_CYTMA|nr:Golgi apparatus membrane protein tvp38 [Valsa mali var. pyri (nom. inval.)]
MPADYNSAASGGNKTLSAASAAQQLGMDTSSPQDTPFRDDEDEYHDGEGDVNGDGDHPSASDQPPLPWARQSNGHPTASRRLSHPYSLNSRTSAGGAGAGGDTSLRGQLTAFTAQTLKTANKAYQQSIEMYTGLPRTKQLLVVAAAVLLFAIAVTLLVFSHRIFTLLGPVAVSWRNLPGGWLIIWGLTFLVAFPPLIGYSTACTVAGFVYGFPLGWPIVASATVAGSLASFLAARTVFSAYVDRLVGQDRRFVALGQVLRHDGLGVLALVRFCPLPYSLSNGFLATVPSIQPLSFALATAFSSPKLLVHVFIGSRLALLAEKGDEMTFGDRLVNYVSMLVGGLVGMGVGYFIYRRTMARAAELAREEAEAGRSLDGRAGAGGVGGEYADDGVEGGEGARLMDPNDAAALMVDDDDISLWDTAGDDGGFVDEEGGDGHGRYRDEEEAVGGDLAARKGQGDDDPWA